jgi:hypothetical protein
MINYKEVLLFVWLNSLRGTGDVGADVTERRIVVERGWCSKICWTSSLADTKVFLNQHKSVFYTITRNFASLCKKPLFSKSISIRDSKNEQTCQWRFWSVSNIIPCATTIHWRVVLLRLFSRRPFNVFRVDFWRQCWEAYNIFVCMKRSSSIGICVWRRVGEFVVCILC